MDFAWDGLLVTLPVMGVNMTTMRKERKREGEGNLLHSCVLVVSDTIQPQSLMMRQKNCMHGFHCFILWEKGM